MSVNHPPPIFIKSVNHVLLKNLGFKPRIYRPLMTKGIYYINIYKRYLQRKAILIYSF